jgi:hypothetical protein
MSKVRCIAPGSQALYVQSCKRSALLDQPVCAALPDCSKLVCTLQHWWPYGARTPACSIT